MHMHYMLIMMHMRMPHGGAGETHAHMQGFVQ